MTAHVEQKLRFRGFRAILGCGTWWWRGVPAAIGGRWRWQGRWADELVHRAAPRSTERCGHAKQLWKRLGLGSAGLWGRDGNECSQAGLGLHGLPSPCRVGSSLISRTWRLMTCSKVMPTSSFAAVVQMWCTIILAWDQLPVLWGYLQSQGAQRLHSKVLLRPGCISKPRSWRNCARPSGQTRPHDQKWFEGLFSQTCWIGMIG